MQVYAPGSDKALRSDLIVRAVQRSDLVPIPATIELELRTAADTAGFVEGARVKAGRESAEFEIVKRSPSGASGRMQGDQPQSSFKVVGLLASCAAIARRLQRSVIRNNASLGEIYRACGAQVQIANDFPVGMFACYRGMIPSFEVAKALQEDAGALVLERGKIAFKRLAQMTEGKPVATLREDSAAGVESEFLERHMVPFAFSTSDDSAIVSGRSESARGTLYRPRADARVLNNLATALVMRRKVESSFAPHIAAGMRIDVGDKIYAVITAAHAWSGGADGDDGEQKTRLWLGQVVKP